MKVAFIGSRQYPDLTEVRRVVREILREIPEFTLVSGGATGVDKAAEYEFRWHTGREPVIYLPDYQKFGRYKAPILRNSLIVEECDYAIAFWDGQSTGTQDTLNKLALAGKPFEVYFADGRKEIHNGSD